jgi:hypothetical protein
MPSGLMPLSKADPAEVKRYLLNRHMQTEIVDWKYFDPQFNRDRERGVVFVRENQVAGFLGLIPFSVQHDGLCRDCAWSCDWSVDPRQGAGMGLLLVKRARELYDGIFNVGGNENTRQIFPRLADLTVPNAGMGLVLPLRLGSIFPRLPRWLKRLLPAQEILGQLPLRWVRAGSRTQTAIDQGLSPNLLSLISDTPRGDWRPIYDSEFFDWQFRRCPAISCWSCSISPESPFRTAALIWRSRWSKEFWRVIFCGDTTDSGKIELLVSAVVWFAYSRGCIALFTIVSHRESHLLELFRGRGFLRHQKLPLYIMRGRYAALPVDEFSALSFLDADLAYRFESDDGSSGAE